MIIRTKDLRDLCEYQIDNFFNVVLMQQDKRAIFYDCWISHFINTSRRYRFQTAKEIMFLLNDIFKYHEIVPNFYISDYSLKPKKI